MSDERERKWGDFYDKYIKDDMDQMMLDVEKELYFKIVEKLMNDDEENKFQRRKGWSRYGS